MFNKLRVLILLPIAAFAGLAIAGDQAAIQQIMSKLPGLSADEISEGPVEGLYEVIMGSQVAYVTADGRYLIRGEIIDVETSVNLTERRLNTARTKMLASLSDEDMIIFEPENVEHTITVFTDIDCGYCRKLHREMEDLHSEGIRVQYLFFPRSGPDTPSWQKADAVWCADDRNEALTNAKAGAPLPPASCADTPIASQYKLGKDVGLRGTPTIVTETGELIPGYLPAKQLVARLQQAKQQTAQAQ